MGCRCLSGLRASPLLRTVAVVLSVVVQAAVLFMTFVMSLGWGGATWAVANLQALLGFGVIAALARHRHWRALLVPVVSALLTFGLVMLGDSLGETGALQLAGHSAAFWV